MYLYKDDCGFYLTHDFHNDITYCSYCCDQCDIKLAEYCGYVEGYDDICTAILEYGGNADDLLSVMEDYEYNFSPID